MLLSMSAGQPERCDDESADRDDAPSEVGAERGDFRAEHIRRDVLAVLCGLPNGISDGVGLFRGELGLGQCTSDGVRVEHKPC